MPSVYKTKYGFIIIITVAVLAAGFFIQNSKKQALPATQVANTECPSQTSQLQCWQDSLKQTLSQQGLPAAFDALAELFRTEPVFAAECHAYVHQLGQAAYELFATNQNFELNSKTQYCGYGFYHGFMESLLQSTYDVNQAQEFCDYVGKKLAGQTTDGAGACYHGIGHGAVDGSDPRAWGSPQAMIDPSLKLCVFVSAENKQYLYRCVTGVYNALEILSSDPKYKLSMIVENPFFLCPSQPLSYQEGCYTNMLPALLRLTQNDLSKSEKIIEKITEKAGTAIKTSVSASLFHEFIRLNLDQTGYNIEKGIQLCQSLSDPYRLACIDGLSGGHMKYGEPTKEYIKGLNFCRNKQLNADEASTCHNSILSRLRIWYSAAKSQEICSSVDSKFQTYCNL